MNPKNTIQKKWLILLAAFSMLAFTLRDIDFNQMKSISFEDVLPLVVMIALIFVVKTSVFSLLLLGLRKIWGKFRKTE